MKHRKVLFVLLLLAVFGVAIAGAFGYGMSVGRYKQGPYFWIKSLQASAKNVVRGRASGDQGQKLFENSCARCHGRDGSGGVGPSLNRPDLTIGDNDDALRSLIAYGSPLGGMPGIHTTEDEQIQLVAYVRSLAKRSPPVLSGNVSKGALLYDQHECSACHIVKGEGIGVGPDLTRIGAFRGTEYLRQALTDPASAMPRGLSPVAEGRDEYRPVQVVTTSGVEILGMRINEDPFTIQLRDGGNRQYSFRKDELREFREVSGRSFMPSFKASLNASELDDLVAYLASLGGSQ